MSGTSVSVAPGATAGNASTITLTPGGGFTGNVALTAAITSSPTGAQDPPSLSFGSTTPVDITGTSAGTATLTILTTAATLHAHGLTNIQTAKDAAEALRPLAGNGAYLLFTLGIIGTGMLAVPVLAGSSAYAVAESAAWGASMDRPLKVTPKFYAVLATAVAIGMVLDFAGFNSVRMLFLSAILNGLLAPPLIVLVILLTNSQKVMGDRKNGPVIQGLGWICAAVMAACGIAMFVT